MGLILNLETATKTCSVSLAQDGKELATINHTAENYSHAEKLNGIIQEVMEKANRQLADLDAIAVSEGPGSYTGLRIGTSTAKGLCFALDIPLIAVNSLKALAQSKAGADMLICPMFDARRMEVYAAIFDSQMNVLQPTKAIVIDDATFLDFLQKEPVCFIGPGAEKCRSTVVHENAIFDLETAVSASGMIPFTEEKFQQNDLEDLAYFEPFYLKDFIAGKPKKLLS